MGGQRALILATVLLLGTTVLAAVAPASSDGPAIQPGASAGGCTLNFVFDGTGPLAGNVYIGTAGHCTTHGHPVSNAEVGIIGTTVYDNDGITDFALIQVDQDKTDRVQAHVRGHPGTPTGATTADEAILGDLLLLSGYGQGLHFYEATRENRTGVLMSQGDQEYTANAPLVPGDSGGPIVHMETGKALGIVSHFNLFAFPPTTDEGPTVEHILQELHEDGFPVTLRTV